MTRVNEKFREPHELLAGMAETFKERNAVYGRNYLTIGKILSNLFPNGVTLKTEADFGRFHFVVMDVVKTSRYCNNFASGGHQDSVHDGAVYKAMLEAVDEYYAPAYGPANEEMSFNLINRGLSEEKGEHFDKLIRDDIEGKDVPDVEALVLQGRGSSFGEALADAFRQADEKGQPIPDEVKKVLQEEADKRSQEDDEDKAIDDFFEELAIHLGLEDEEESEHPLKAKASPELREALNNVAGLLHKDGALLLANLMAEAYEPGKSASAILKDFETAAMPMVQGKMKPDEVHRAAAHAIMSVRTNGWSKDLKRPERMEILDLMEGYIRDRYGRTE